MNAPVLCGTATSASSSSNTFDITLSTAIAVGDLIIVDASNDGGANVPASCTDDGGTPNTYSADDAGQRLADNYSRRRFSAVCTQALAIGAKITVTIVGGGGTWDRVGSVVKVTPESGFHWDSTRIDKQASATGTSTSPSSGATATTTVANELVYGVMVAGGAPTSTGGGPLTAAGAGYTKLANINGGSFIDIATVYQTVSATAAYTASGTWQASDAWACHVSTYMMVADGGSQVTNEWALAYDILNQVTREWQLAYDIKNQVTREWALAYDILNQTSNEWTLSYDILSASQVTREWALSYDIQNQVSREWALAYDIQNQVSREWTLAYDLLNGVTREWALSYDILNQTSNEWILAYDIGIVAATNNLLRLRVA